MKTAENLSYLMNIIKLLLLFVKFFEQLNKHCYCSITELMALLYFGVRVV